jgi:hypothetical protein
MDESPLPVPDPSGALVPPGNRPPTTTATAMLPNPEPAPRRPVRVEDAPWTRLLTGARALANAVLDATDEAVDRVAEAVGLRGRRE